MSDITIDPSTIQQNAAYRTLCTLGRGYHGPHVAYCWACPQCGGHVVATHDEHTDRFEIARDARCVLCRRKETP